MAEFATQRKTMVDNQIRTVDVTDRAVIDAFGSIGREAFVPAGLAALAYVDRSIEVAPGRFLIEPAQLARMIQLAAPVPGEKALVVGGATGYTAAIVAQLTGSATLLECDAGLAAAARTALAATPAVTVVEGPLTAGWAAAAPYDLVIFDGAFDDLPEAVIAQVAEGGRIVGVRGTGPSSSVVVVTKAGGTVSIRPAFYLPAAMLPGFARAREFAL